MGALRYFMFHSVLWGNFGAADIVCFNALLPGYIFVKNIHVIFL